MLRVASFGVLLGISLVGCSGGASESKPKESAVAVLSPEMVAASWPVQMSDDTKRAPFEGHAGWAAMFQRDLSGARAAFAANPADGRGLARVHSDLADLYRQAVWLGVQATRNVYGTDRQDTDPAEADYLVGVAHALAGDCGSAKDSLARVKTPSDALVPYHSFWSTWANDPACPTLPSLAALQALPGAPAPVGVGQDPEVGALPVWTFSEQSEEARSVQSGELTSLLTLAMGHAAAAREASPDSDDALVALRSSAWMLGIEGKPQPATIDSVDPSWLFLDFALVGPDFGFLQAAQSDGLSAVTAWADRSALAAALAPAVKGDQLDVEVVIDRAAEIRIQLRTAMEQASGTPLPFHPPFAAIAEVAVLRAGMIVANTNNQYRDAGVLRINAFERSDGPGRDPVFLLSTAAWDAGNRSPLRAQEIVHGLLSRYPSVRAARYPLDALHIRLGRTASPSTPVH